ncbi:MAG: hypothetical protein D3923_15025 [Candidatus Electrothrix sp. AR3]|nr:hypothetical protein [Candidatus Electrothrix sp. AR3]
MNPMITSIAGLITTLTGACAMLLMLELRGNPGSKQANHRLVKAHRITGYVFIIFFFIILMTMFLKVGTYQEEFSPRTMLHIALGILLIPLLTIKILMVRRFKRLGSQVPGLGLAVFLLLFLLNTIAGGYYFLHWSDMGQVFLSEQDADLLDEKFGQRLVTEKCIKCHTLERVFRSFKSEEEWTKTINRMAVIAAPNIRDFDAKQIIHYLVKQQQRRQVVDPEFEEDNSLIDTNLIEEKCTSCHTLDRINEAEKSRAEWKHTVDKMIGYSDQMNFLNQKEQDAIIDLLTNRDAPQQSNSQR